MTQMRAIRIVEAGPRYRLEVEEIARPSPGAGEVLIRVAGAGINRADLLQAEGRYPPPKGASDIPGLEVAGEIVELGFGVSGFRQGDLVCALLAGGGYAEYCLASALCVLPVPERVAIEDAGALPEAHFTVWTNLMDTARLASGESVLIHGGASGIGTTAIQLCSALGHTVFTTAGDEAKCAACEKLGANRAINYRSDDFTAVVQDMTQGRGVDVILDMVGGDYIERNFRALARGGRLVNIAFQKGPTAEVNFGLMLMKRLTFAATTLRARSDTEKGSIRDALAARVWPLLAKGRIRPVIDRVFAFTDAQAAHGHMASGAHIGKILLKP
ncbi:MAG TPA: NAD(P)H-quinone oxidoreductase [Rhizomicrobium sp.]